MDEQVDVGLLVAVRGDRDGLVRLEGQQDGDLALALDLVHLALELRALALVGRLLLPRRGRGRQHARGQATRHPSRHLHAQLLR